MNGWEEIVSAVIFAPLGLAFWSWLASFPLRLAIQGGRLLPVVSVVVGFVACVAMLLSKNLPEATRLAYLIALLPSAPLVLLWSIGRQSRLRGTVYH